MDEIHEFSLIFLSSFPPRLQSIINGSLNYEINFIFISTLIK